MLEKKSKDHRLLYSQHRQVMLKNVNLLTTLQKKSFLERKIASLLTLAKLVMEMLHAASNHKTESKFLNQLNKIS